MSKWTSRKLWLAMFWQAVNTALLVFQHIPDQVYLTITWLLIGGYFVGNISSHYLAGSRGVPGQSE